MKIKGINLKKFAMKWRFRLDHARAIFGLLTFALLLAAGYVQYIPFLERLGFLGVVILTVFMFIVFGIGGYIYDRLLRLWEDHTVVAVERSPYTYVPSPKEYMLSNATCYIHAYLLFVFDETKEEAKLYEKMLDEYFSLSPATEGYVEKSEEIKKLSLELIKKLKEKMKDD